MVGIDGEKPSLEEGLENINLYLGKPCKFDKPSKVIKGQKQISCSWLNKEFPDLLGIPEGIKNELKQYCLDNGFKCVYVNPLSFTNPGGTHLEQHMLRLDCYYFKRDPIEEEIYTDNLVF